MRYKKYIKFYPGLLLAFALFSSGCEEKLDFNPIAKETEVTFYKDATSIDETCIAAYAQLSARDVFDKEYYMTLGSIPSDDVECGGETINDYQIAQHMDQFLHSKVDGTPMEAVWQYCYKGSRLANTAIEKMKLPSMKLSQSFIDLKTGEMEFLLAYYHFTLLQVFGAVPIADKTIQPDNFYKSRNSIKEVLDFCTTNLKDAATKLPVSNAAEPGRATKGAANALLAKVLLYESSYARNYKSDAFGFENKSRFEGCTERWKEALDAAEAVINSGTYKLVGIDGERFHSWRTWPDSVSGTVDGYRWLFTADGDNSAEGIFEIQSVNDNLGYGSTRGNVMTVYQTVRKYKNGATLGDVGGWGFNCPTDGLVAAFRNAQDNVTRETGINSTPYASEYDDPRFKTTVGIDGDTIIINTSTGLKQVQMDLANISTHRTGRKFECSYAEYWKAGQFTQGPFNVRILRYADVLLMAAEAAVMNNDPAKALTYVNMVRTRARKCGNTGKPENLTVCSFEDVIHERRLELALEPSRFFDLVRWGLTSKYLNNMPILALGDYKAEFVPGKHEFFPLPNNEVQLSKGKLIQYPAWE